MADEKKYKITFIFNGGTNYELIKNLSSEETKKIIKKIKTPNSWIEYKKEDNKGLKDAVEVGIKTDFIETYYITEDKERKKNEIRKRSSSK